MMRTGARRTKVGVVTVLCVLVAVGLLAFEPELVGQESSERGPPGEEAPPEVDQYSATGEAPPGSITLAFSGDVHFEGALRSLPDTPDSTLGQMSAALRDADIAMVNLEGALTSGGSPTGKEREVPERRYWFRAPPNSLGVLARSGVDVATVANNHGADYGTIGLRETIEIARDDPPVAIVGAGADRAEAFTPYRQRVRGTDVAVFAADASRRESADAIWAAGEGGPGLASAHADPARNLLRAVRDHTDDDDLVVVYLHWGEEGASCPSESQRRLVASLAEAGADVIVGSHSHTIMGSGMYGETYVNYGLGNFAWYHGNQPDTGVLRLRIGDGKVADEDWLPARTPKLGGTAVPRVGEARTKAIRRQADQRGCTNLEPAPGSIDSETAVDGEPDETSRQVPAFVSGVEEIGPTLRTRMTASHDPAACPVALADLRYVTVRHLDFDGQIRTGELVVAAEVADNVIEVFRKLYRARFPIARMRLVDEYDGDDSASMAANNSSGYNCRAVAGTDELSDHAYGRAIDLNPIQNPYLLPDRVLPRAGRRFADIDRTPRASVAPGVIRTDDVVTRAFAAAGWVWGASFGDYQHFSAP